jgi:N-acetyl-anhydromuramyl-L-alanine amidase AmpD
VPYQLGLPAALAKYGLKVETVAGWQTRGNPSFNPRGSVNHHTAGSPNGIRPSLDVVTNGRAGLSGPLCNVFLDRNGVAVVVAAGRANHAGQGGYRGLTGNSSVFGTEAESTGVGPSPWTKAQLEAYPKVVAALQELAGQKNADTNCNHKTWAPYRKVDCASLTDDWFKVQANELLKTGGDDMFSDEDRARQQRIDSIVWNVLDQLGGTYDVNTGQINWTRQISKVNPKDGGFRPIDYITWGDKYDNDADKLLRQLVQTVTELKAEVAALKKQ